MPLAVRQRLAKSFELVAELLGVALSASGTTLAAIFGKLLLAAVLGFIAFGVILRLTSRRAKRIQPQQSTPRWVQPLPAAFSIVEVAVIVEATDLPVRFISYSSQSATYGTFLSFSQKTVRSFLAVLRWRVNWPSKAASSSMMNQRSLSAMAEFLNEAGWNHGVFLKGYSTLRSADDSPPLRQNSCRLH